MAIFDYLGLSGFADGMMPHAIRKQRVGICVIYHHGVTFPTQTPASNPVKKGLDKDTTEEKKISYGNCIKMQIKAKWDAHILLSK